MQPRFPLLLDTPPERVLLFNVPTACDLSFVSHSVLQIVEMMKPVADDLTARGYDVVQSPHGAFDVAIVMLPRSKPLAKAQIETAMRHAPQVIVEGAKTDGVESLLKDMKRRMPVGAQVSKSHGKAFLIDAAPELFEAWTDAGPLSIVEGFETRVGVFSYDRIDRGSALLAEALPAKLPPRMADFGAGWGYLSRHILAKEGVKSLDMIEAHHSAVLCAKANVPQAQALWEDATSYKAPTPYQGIVMNPPFHQTRAAAPELGQAFIRSAARNLISQGELWMVANRQLPYEETLTACFQQVEQLGQSEGFKLLYARKPF